MRVLVAVTAVVAVVACNAIDARAFDAKGKFFVSANGGPAIPIADFADDDSSNVDAGAASTGFALGLSAEYGVTEQFLVGGRFAYNRFGVSDKLIDDLGFDNGHWTVIEIVGIYAKYLVSMTGNTRPYGRAGIFLGKPELSIEDTDGDWTGEYDVSVGLEAAIGVTHMFSKNVGAGVEARFAHLSANESDDIVPLSLARRNSQLSPNGVRDPGGNIDWMLVDVYISFAP